MHFAKKIEKEVKSMKISKIVVMKNLNNGRSEEAKLNTKEIREFSFPKKDYIINKVFIDNLWLKIAVLVWFLVLSALLVLAKNSENYGLLSILIFKGLMTITLISNFYIIRLYFFGEKNLNIEKRLITRWVLAPTEGFKQPKNTEVKKRNYLFENRAFKEINKFAIRFYFSHLAVILGLLFIVTLLMAENQPDKISLIIISGLWILSEFYFYMLRRFIRAKTEASYNITLVNDGAKKSAILEVRFSLNGEYAIEEAKLSNKTSVCRKI